MFSFVPTMSSGARLMPGSSKGMVSCLIDRGTYPQQWFQSAAPEEQAACCRLATYLEGRIRLAYKRGRRRSVLPAARSPRQSTEKIRLLVARITIPQVHCHSSMVSDLRLGRERRQQHQKSENCHSCRPHVDPSLMVAIQEIPGALGSRVRVRWPRTVGATALAAIRHGLSHTLGAR